jgi:non-heme chloroperoxidase
VDQFGTGTVRALVLVDGTIRDERSIEAVRDSWGWVRALQLNRREGAEKFVRSMYLKPQPEEYLRRITAASLKTPTSTAVALIANMVMSGDRSGALGKLDRPVLYAVTARMKTQAEMLKARLPTARVEVFEDCGHALFVDDAPRFNRTLEEFLAAGR